MTPEAAVPIGRARFPEPACARTGSTHWLEANQAALAEELARVRLLLEAQAGERAPAAEVHEPEREAGAAVREAAASALDALCAGFGLTPFERDVLLLCAGVELDTRFGPLCGRASGNPQRTQPTFGLALAVLPGAHWSALVPASPLRYWRLLETGAEAAITAAPLRIDERVLHHLLGISHLDERLDSLLDPLAPPVQVTSSLGAVAARIAGPLWGEAHGGSLQLCGGDAASSRAAAALACARLGAPLFALAAADVPGSASERHALARLWDREALLTGAALLVECGEADAAEATRAALALVERLRGPVLVATREPLRLRRSSARLDVDAPSADEQRMLWRAALGEATATLDGEVEAVVAQFRLGLHGIQAAAADLEASLADRQEGEPPASDDAGEQALPDTLGAVSQPSRPTGSGGAVPSARGEEGAPRAVGPPGLDEPGEESVPPAGTLWDACRRQARWRMEALAQRVEPTAGWEDLVLPDGQRQILRQIAVAVRRRAQVYGAWGFAARGARGLGISALFAGASGTGKTMASEVLARELSLDLYRIDLSQVVSKYIGETEKNLRRVFDAAEEGGAILLFDEADALFGKRSEVKDSHDRYANIEVSYLLQRMEAYRGLAILTTNMKNALDPAFLRRLRFVVQFPFPDAAQREEIWRRIFPPQTPTERLEPARLARLNVAGGNIRNIALGAAFLAAEAGEPVRMGHVLQAARAEYAKLERSLTEAEVAAWE